jgi:hypothetical protein
MDELRRRATAGSRGSRTPGPRRIGEPNVLSDAATPNVLSTQTGRPRPLAVRASRAGSAARVGPMPQANQGWPATSQPAAQGRVRLPSFGTLLFLGFLAITAVRVLGQVASGITGPTSEPVATSPAGTGSEVAPGPVTFGTGQGTDCDVTGAAAEFGRNVDVWWSAELSTRQPADAAAVVIVRRGGEEVQRDFVPSDSSFGEWSVLCAGEPITLHEPGGYRLEVWNEAETVLHAAGEYRVRDS